MPSISTTVTVQPQSGTVLIPGQAAQSVVSFVGPPGPIGATGPVNKVSGVSPDGTGNVDLSSTYATQQQARAAVGLAIVLGA